MNKNRKYIRIICTKENEEEMMQVISEFNFSICNRYDRGIIILDLELSKNYNPHQLEQLLNLQDKLLKLS